jgi:organic radical activating enzyme
MLGWYIAVETNGSKPVPLGIDWVTCSPKVAEHAVQVERANEVKYVRHVGQALPKPKCDSENYLLSPAFTTDGVDRAALAWCIHLCKEHPIWRLSMQQHKLWGVR